MSVAYRSGQATTPVDCSDRRSETTCAVLRSYFRGKAVVITGGASGIGLALAKAIAGSGARAIMLVDLEKHKYSNAICSLQTDYPMCEIQFEACDVADSNAVEGMAVTFLRAHGAPDILINNAGYAHYERFHEMNLSEIVRHIDVNLVGPMRVTSVFLSALRTRKEGHIVNIASIAGHFLLLPNLAYCAAKHGIVAWSRGLGLELAADNIHVQVISPGRVVTNFFAHESFRRRAPGRETSIITLPVEKFIRRAMDAISRRERVTFVPKYWAVFAWALHAFPRLLEPIHFIGLKKRLERLEEGEKA